MKWITLLLLLPLTVLAEVEVDVIHLIGGSVIKGSIVELIPDEYVKIRLDNEVQVYRLADVARIDKEWVKAPVPRFKLGGVETNPLRKGAVNLGGLLSYSRVSVEGAHAGSQLRLQPSMGYFVADKTSLHLGLSFSRQVILATRYEDDTSITGFSLGTRGYQLLAHNIGYVGIHFTTMIQQHELAQPGFPRQSESATMNALMLEAGYLQALNRYVFLDGGLGYLKEMGGNRSGTLSASLGLLVFLK